MNVPCDTEIGALLLTRARAAIARRLGLALPSVPDAPWLHDKGACFVTLTQDGSLRGCIGSLRPQRTLGEDVDHNAVAAAFDDPRFPPLSAREYPLIRIEVSLLSVPEFLDIANENELIDQLQPGRDGLILFSGCRSATFLPQVWEQLPEPHRFVSALKQKAGLDPMRPTPNLMAATYTVRKWREACVGTDSSGAAVEHGAAR